MPTRDAPHTNGHINGHSNGFLNGHANGLIENGRQTLVSKYNFINGKNQKPAHQYKYSHSRDLHEDTNLPIPELSAGWSAIFVFLLATACFAISYDGDLVYDDKPAIVNNADVYPGTPLSHVFTDDFWGKSLTDPTSHKSFRPLTTLTFRWSYYFGGGLNPAWFHVPNILLHGVVSLLLLPVLTSLFRGGRGKDPGSPEVPFPKSAVLSAVLFAVHPIHTESVSSVVGRADLLCALLYLLSFYCYIQACRTGLRDDQNNLYPTGTFSRPLLFVAMVMCCLSTLCKEQGITVLGVCSVYDIVVWCKVDLWKPFRTRGSYLNRGCSGESKKTVDSDWLVPMLKRHVVLFVTGLILLLTRWRLMGNSLPKFQADDNPHAAVNDTVLRILNINYIYSLNAWLLLNPLWLCFDWSMGCVPVLQSLTDPRVLAVILMWGTILTLMWTCLRGEITAQQRVLTVSLALLVVPFLPASNVFFTVGFVVAERALYLPSIGWCVLVTMGIHRFCQSHQTYAKTIRWCLMLLVGLYMARSVQRSGQWRTEMTLFTSGVSVCPLNAKIHFNLGKKHEDEGSKDFAIEKYREAIRLNPDYDNPHNNMGVLLYQRGDYEEAESLLRRAIQISPGYATAWNNLGIVEAAMLKHGEAESCYRRAIQLSGTHPEALYNLGNLFNDLRKYDEALESWETVTKQDPGHVPAWANRALLLSSIGKADESIRWIKEGLKIHPTSADLHAILAGELGKLGRILDSERHFKRAITLQPQDARNYANLGVLYHMAGRLGAARQAYRQALTLNPAQPTAAANLPKLAKREKEN